MLKLFSPNFFATDNKAFFRLTFVLGWAAILLSIAQFNSNELLPKPTGIVTELGRILTTHEFYDDLVATFFLILKSMGIAVVISLFFSYIFLIPALSPLSAFVAKLRFLTYTGIVFVFTVLVKNGSDIKMSLLLFGVVPYFITSFLAYVSDIPRKEYELCYTLKMNSWRTLYEVVVRGRLHVVLEVIKQNFAIAWMMITSVEGLCMSEGGIGTMMVKSNRVMHIESIFAILIVVFLLGMFFDYLFDLSKVYFFPYTDTKRYNKLWIVQLGQFISSKFSKTKTAIA